MSDLKAIIQFTVKFAKEKGRFPYHKEYSHEHLYQLGKAGKRVSDVRNDILNSSPELSHLSSKARKEELSKSYLKWGVENLISDGSMLSYTRFKELHKDEFEKIRHHFQSIKNFEKELRKLYPSKFSFKTIHDIFINKPKVKTSKKVIVITSAVTGCKVFTPALEALKYYCSLRDGEILVLPSSDPAKKNKDIDAFELDHRLYDHTKIVLNDLYLNNNLMISKIKLSAKQIDATTGLARLSQRTGTFIFSSPKQRLKSIPVSNTKSSRLLVTTGAITLPDYDTDRYMSERTSEIAHYDHKMGALIVEIENDERFHIRHVQFDDEGKFIDFGVEFSGNSHKKVKTLSLWPGDWHTLETCPKVRKQIIEVCGELKPDYLFFNDFFSGISVNPHEASDKIIKSQLHLMGHMSLKNELEACSKELEESLNWGAKKVIVVKSNHDDFLENWYLRKANYIDRDGEDYRLGLQLSLALLDNHNPIEFYVRNHYGLKSNRLRFLKIDEDFYLAGVQHGSHGHLGSGGKRNPNANGLEMAYGRGNYGHGHYAEILREVYRAGTSTPTRLPYVKGSCNWNNSHIITYYNGSRQLFFTFDDYRLRRNIVKV